MLYWGSVVAVALAASVAPIPATAALTICAENVSTDFYVNPMVRHPKGTHPSGLSTPPRCAFPTIGKAIAAIKSRGLGEGVRIILTGAADGTPAIFKDEAFPLAVPSGVAVTTTDDVALGGEGWNPANYIVRFTGSAARAIDLTGGSVAGFTMVNRLDQNAARMVRCSQGVNSLESVSLQGKKTLLGVVMTGIDLVGTCDLHITGTRIFGFKGTGVVAGLNTSLSLEHSQVYNNKSDGVSISGTASMLSSEIAFNRDDGVVVLESTGSTFADVNVRDNGGNGFEIHPSDVSFDHNYVHNNSRSTGWDEAQMLFFGPATYSVGQEIEGCPEGMQNWIYSYDISDLEPGSVGIFATDGAVVNAENNVWRSADSTRNVGYDAGSQVSADLMCGTFTTADPDPPPPVL
jgi:hypothetical protein